MAVLGLGACGPLPRPFAPDSKETAIDAPYRPVDGAGIVVVAPQLGEFTGPVFAQVVAEALRRAEIPATSSGGNQGSLRLGATLLDVRNDHAHGLRWTLRNATGKHLGEFEQRIAAVGRGEDKSQHLAARANIVAAGVVGMLGKAPKVARPAPLPELLVPPVSGAPGDGVASLSRAMQKALVAAGAPLAAAESDGTHRVLGRVTLTDTQAGNQHVEVVWVVRAPDGRDLGTVRQKNTVPGGTLDGEWGSVATAIAAAGAGGVIEILRRAGSS